MPRYLGSCHCGHIRFEIDAVIERVTDCNCSICSKKGILHVRVPPENFRLLSGGEHLGTYQFGTMWRSIISAPCAASIRSPALGRPLICTP